MSNSIESKSIATIRTLSIDAVDKANSGHPGMPMGAAPMTYSLWAKHLNINPENPEWFNRDRFVLSAGHGSALLYSMLHLSGFDLTIDDLKSFRQWGSKTPGHPEFRHTAGVDATTGPLGQGIGMAVGMALAERHLAETYNRDHFNIVDHFTYAICGDGDLMEGISNEAASLAGHLKLGRLIVMYDSNDISLDGELHQSFSEDVKQRFEALNWEVLYIKDGNNVEEISAAIEKAKQNQSQPTLIEIKTTIGFGSPNRAGTSGVHGAPLGLDETKLTKEAYKWTYDEDFYVPSEVYDHFQTEIKESGKKKESEWNALFSEYKKEYPELAALLEAGIKGELPEGWDKDIPVYEKGSKLATRASSGEALNGIAKNLPFFFGGSADLAGSNKTTIKNAKDFSAADYSGKNIWFGVREFAMGAALNGMALHGGLRVFAGTFFVFSDYLRPAIRLASLMGLPVTYVFTHDSVAVGEDGPTHEPIEQLPSLRAMPNLSVIRPADANETAAAWKLAVSSETHPTALVLTRQNLETIDQSADTAFEGVSKGAYVVSASKNEQADALLLATGSEVNLALAAQEELAKENIDVSVVSMPSWNRFESQSDEYKESVLPSQVTKRLAIEMASPFGWERYTGSEGDILGINQFGASAPGDTIIKEFGFTTSNVVNRVKNLLNK
ncbi:MULTISPECIES: transketolase [Bacillus]|uniref:Transketolase n=2 Tax=Bacillus TaxID=1386 RepID=A0A0M3R9C0_9BACI|nr:MULTISPECIES: transketolase [Bacillus]ALC81156.1 transketolase [Bacillus gobiensis]MBP1080125.1 transketolase [Bacillus capparidis]MED1095511.1 transketolase [Bacillus capparidis]